MSPAGPPRSGQTPSKTFCPRQAFWSPPSVVLLLRDLSSRKRQGGGGRGDPRLRLGRGSALQMCGSHDRGDFCRLRHVPSRLGLSGVPWKLGREEVCACACVCTEMSQSLHRAVYNAGQVPQKCTFFSYPKLKFCFIHTNQARLGLAALDHYESLQWLYSHSSWPVLA